MTQQVTLCRLEDIDDGGSKGLWPDSRGRALVMAVRRGDRVFAYLNICPHYERSRLGWKKDEFLNGDRDKVVCSAHGALFEIETGECVLGPCLGQQLTRLDTTILDGKIIADLNELPERDSGRRQSA